MAKRVADLAVAGAPCAPSARDPERNFGLPPYIFENQELAHLLQILPVAGHEQARRHYAAYCCCSSASPGATRSESCISPVVSLGISDGIAPSTRFCVST